MASIRKTSSGKWMARVSMNGKARSIGTFTTKKEAEEKAAVFEKELKPHFLLPDVDKILEKQITDWKALIKKYEEARIQKHDFHLEIETAQEEIQRLEKSLKIFKNKKKLQEKATIENIESIFTIF